MGHVLSNMTIKGEKGERALTDILVDSGATYTVLSPRVMEQVGAVKASLTTDVELGDGGFEGAREVIGGQTLEALGLRLDPATGKLEATRPKNLAYFYSMSCSISKKNFGKGERNK